MEISNLNMDVAKRDDEIVKFNKEIADLNAKLQKYEDKQSTKQGASKQNSTRKSLFGRKNSISAMLANMCRSLADNRESRMIFTKGVTAMI